MATPTPSPNYLAKLLTLLIRKNGDQIRIPIQDLSLDDSGQGFQVHFDQGTKELVLTFVPPGSSIYKIEESVTWLTNQPQKLASPVQERSPLTHEDLIARAWSQSAGTPTEAEIRARQARPKVRAITDQDLAEAEEAKRKSQILHELESYTPPEREAGASPRSQAQREARTPSRQMETFLKP